MKRVLGWDRLLKVAGIIAVSQFVLHGQAMAAVPDSEREALIKLFESTGGETWSKKAFWNTDTDVCDWFGVTCSSDGAQVTGLSLNSNELTGSIPSVIGDLLNLQELQLHQNSLTGSLPVELNKLTNLTSLYLDSNNLRGGVDDSLVDIIENLGEDGLDLRYNGLYSKDAEIKERLNSKQIGGDSMSTQTLDAIGVDYKASEKSIELTWNAVDYQQEGGYIIHVYDESGDEVDSALIEGQDDTQINDKETTQATIVGLESGSKYSIEVRSFTNVHGDNVLNQVYSDGLFAGQFEVSTNDVDSDGDGIPDNDEGKNELPARDTDDDGIPDYQDNDDDGDGLLTSEELPTSKDTDEDGTPDYRDNDDDGDGIFTIIETSLGTDLLKADSDGDGISDGVEIGSDSESPMDTDNDGKIDALDQDDDGDSILTQNESSEDLDGDGLLDYRDADDDGDGLLTINEGPVTQDTDKDGIFDYRDDDDDNDGLSTRDEISILKTDPLSIDTDSDGIPDGDEVGGDVNKPRNTDGDNLIDALDSDDDNDGISTSREQPASKDTDSDGTPNYLDNDDDGDSLLTRDELKLGTDPFSKDTDKDGVDDGIEVGGNIDLPKNSDRDNLIDALDPDDDNDSVPTIKEQPGDFDGDGIPNYLDDDDDNDGKPTRVEVRDGIAVTQDSDSDGASDYLDNDDAVVTTSMGGGSAGLVMLMITLLGFVRRFSSCRKFFAMAFLLIFSSKGMAADEVLVTTKTPEQVNKIETEIFEEENIELNEPEDSFDNNKNPQGERFYIGLGVGVSWLDPDTGTTGFSVADDNDVAAKFIMGYEATDHIAVELAGGPMGEASLNPNDRHVKYGVYTLAAVYDFYGDIGGFAPLLKFGVSKISNSANMSYQRDDSLLLSGGLGLKYEFDNGVALRGEYEYLAKDAQLFSISILKYFGKAAVAPAPIVVVPPPPPQHIPAPEVIVSFSVPDSDFDGVNDIRDGCPNTPEGASVDEIGCAMFEGVLQGVNFEYNSSKLTEDVEYILDEVASELKHYPTVKIEVEAHTDSVGSSQYNQWLSERRASSVISFLGSRGVSTKRLTPMGYGETMPLTENNTEEGRAANRRVEFQVLRAQ